MPENTDPLSLDGRVAVVTGAGAGLGRAEAVALAKAGAAVVVNDLPGAGEEAAEEIRALGGTAAVVGGDVGERATADAMVEAALKLGGLDIVVNNAGVTRDKMLYNMTDEEFDLVVKIHLRGHFLLSRNAASYWRGKHKETGEQVYGRIINTASEASLSGSPGQANYAAAKAGITALTLSSARGLGKMGVRANAIAPRARTAMTAAVFGEDQSGKTVDPYSAEHVAPLVAYLAAPASDAINGQVFVVYGGMVVLMEAPAIAQRFDTSGETFDLAELDKTVGAFFADRDPAVNFGADALYKLTI
ncbi:3-oxoacyl-ACP reductase [Marmoricola sp. RAF53]|uniref:3-oxoacyl-ACP reductase n=1 Tax=Marmoricola sp. RAF53 TaxID=3233059 RepID=UPI003F9908A7